MIDVYNNGKTVLALLSEKLFCSFESVFELNGGLRDSRTSMNNKDLSLLVKKRVIGLIAPQYVYSKQTISATEVSVNLP